MPWFLKPRLLRQFKKKSEELIRKEYGAMSDAFLSEEELVEINRDIRTLGDLYLRLFPIGLAWKTKLLRIAIILVVFGGVGGGIGYFLYHPLAVETTSTAVISSEGSGYAFVPHQQAFVSPSSAITRESYSTLTVLAEGTTWAGWVLLGIVTEGTGFAVYTIEPDGPDRVVRARPITADLATNGTPRDLLRGAYTDGTIIRQSNGVLLALTSDGTSAIEVHAFDSTGKRRGTPQTIPLTFPNETAKHLTFGKLADAVGLLTLQLPPPTASVMERAAPILRILDPQTLAVREALLLPGSTDLTFAPGGTILPNPDGAFAIVLPGRPAVRASISNTIKGDELHVLVYGSDRALRQVFQITDNGRPHDTNLGPAVAMDNTLLVPSLRIESLPQNDGDPSGYPPDALGASLITAIGPAWIIAGALIVHEASPVFEEGLPLTGIVRSRIALTGQRLLAVHHLREKQFSEHPERTRIAVHWIELRITSSTPPTPPAVPPTEKTE